nr:hypothetical protein [Sweet potato chlorotic stunt virus]
MINVCILESYTCFHSVYYKISKNICIMYVILFKVCI